MLPENFVKTFVFQCPGTYLLIIGLLSPVIFNKLNLELRRSCGGTILLHAITFLISTWLLLYALAGIDFSAFKDILLNVGNQGVLLIFTLGCAIYLVAPYLMGAVIGEGIANAKFLKKKLNE